MAAGGPASCYFFVCLAWISFAAHVVRGQECPSPFVADNRVDHCVLKVQYAGTDPDPCPAAVEAGGSQLVMTKRCSDKLVCDWRGLAAGEDMPWSAWMEYNHVEFIIAPADPIKLAIASHGIRCQVSTPNL